MTREYAFDWTLDLQSSPEALWPFVADTNRFNHDVGLPAITQVSINNTRPGIKRLRFSMLGITVEWDEQPFEWVYPYRFSVRRLYRRGPFAEVRIKMEMTPQENGGTRLQYRTWFVPSWPLVGDAAILWQIGLVSRFTFLRAFRRYDQLAQEGGSQFDLPGAARFVPGGRQRLESAREAIVKGGDESVFKQMIFLLEHADDLALQRLRPYQLADLWKLPRRAVLEAFLRAARAGIFDLRWELLCPMCRGAAEDHASLSEVHNRSHCPSCNIDFSVNFDRQVEVVFRPNPAVRTIPANNQFCISGPHSQPHSPLVAQMMTGEQTMIQPKLEEGRYSLHASGLPGELPVSVLADGESSITLEINSAGWPEGELRLAPQPILHLKNQAGFPQFIRLERAAWRDDAATAADVTALQVFRDLFSREALRSGEEISISSVTLLFTDLRNSTRLYRQIGDAPAFGRVRQHFDLLEQAIAAEGGAVVKTIGDAVMAVFRQPLAALKAVRAAHAALARLEGNPSLMVKFGIHTGPCIVVTLNERLDYFGSTVNIAARLPGLAEGGEIVFSGEIKNDPEVQTWLRENYPDPVCFQTSVKGYDQPFDLWRMWL
ncbi:MAG: hypothetical protein Fur0016_13260 [Anaerolineales bacterium]